MGRQAVEVNPILVCATILIAVHVLMGAGKLHSGTFTLWVIMSLGALLIGASIESDIAWAILGLLLGNIIFHWIEIWLFLSERVAVSSFISVLLSLILGMAIWVELTNRAIGDYFLGGALGLIVSFLGHVIAVSAGERRLKRAEVQSMALSRDAQQRQRDNKQRQQDAARQKAIKLDNAEITRRSGQLLDSLYHKVLRIPDRSIPIVDLVEEGSDAGDVWFLARHLEGLGDVKLSNPNPLAWTETIELTVKGSNRAEKAKEPAVGAVNIGRLVTMGDFIQAGSNSVVINRSLLTNSLNKVREQVGSDVADAISAVAEEVQRSHNPDAAELFDEFNRELQSENPRKSMLKVLFDGVSRAAPAVSSLTDAATKIAGLFS